MSAVDRDRDLATYYDQEAPIRATRTFVAEHSRSFEAAWSMSTLLHVPNVEFDTAMSEIVRAVRPGAPIAIGLWGGPDSEGPNERNTIQPLR